MQKRGQITLFIILGILLVALILIMVYYRSAITETVSRNILHKQVVLPNEVQKIQDHVQGCVDDTSLILLYQLGGQGGLLKPSADKGIVTDEFFIAYGYNNNKNVLPSLVDSRKDFSAFMNSFLPVCLNIADFEKLDVKPSKPSTGVDFLDDKVKISVDYPITVTQGEDVYRLDDPYEVEYPLRVKFLRELSDGIVKKTISDPKNIDVSYLVSLGVKVDIYPYDNRTLVYSLSDDKSIIANTTYEYRFAARYLR